jgi:hypothetical protein
MLAIDQFLDAELRVGDNLDFDGMVACPEGGNGQRVRDRSDYPFGKS